MHKISLVMLEAQLRKTQMEWKKAFNRFNITEADKLVDRMDMIQNEIDNLKKMKVA